MATGMQVLRAYNRAVKRMQKDEMLAATEVDAGFIFPPGQKRGERVGLQVFVKVRRFSERRLRAAPETGGLL